MMRYAIGMDVGGTKIEAVVADSRGKIWFKTRVPTGSDRTKKEIIRTILSTIKEAKAFAHKKGFRLEGIGMGTPGFISKKGTMSLINNIPAFEGKNIIADIRKPTGMKVAIANDANCFALAEHRFGAAKGATNSIGIIWGTGVGSGIIIDDMIYAGSRGGAGEFGHFVVDPKALKPCINCGNKGDIESFCSAPNLIEYYSRFGGKKEVDSRYIIEGRDKIAKKVRDQCLNSLALGMAALVTIINPEIIVLGGGISNSSHYRKLNSLTNSFLPTSHKNSCRIVKHKIGDSAGVLGAAAMVI
jgi:predicted NBD/HSP70 family sugar kinase